LPADIPLIHQSYQKTEDVLPGMKVPGMKVSGMKVPGMKVAVKNIIIEHKKVDNCHQYFEACDHTKIDMYIKTSAPSLHTTN